MSITLQTILTIKKPTTAHLNFIPRSSIPSLIPTQRFTIRRFSAQRHQLPAKICASSRQEPYAASPTTSFDSFLSILEVITLSSSAGISAYVIFRHGVRKAGTFAASGVPIWQLVVLLCGVLVGAVIRRRQWMRISGHGFGRKGIGGEVVDVLERVEKLEDELQSTVKILHAQSRRLEKLGIRFRVTRKSLKDPIAETAALVRKNSEATRELAVQEGILENELGEIQKVLLAMQEQQQKQLELILAIAKLSGNSKGSKILEKKSPIETHKSSSALDGVVNSARK